MVISWLLVPCSRTIRLLPMDNKYLILLSTLSVIIVVVRHILFINVRRRGYQFYPLLNVLYVNYKVI